MDDPLDSFLEWPLAEIQQKAYLEAAEADLTQNLMAIRSQRVGQAELVGILQEPWAQGALDSDRRPDDGLGDFHMRMVIALVFPPMPRHSPPSGA